MATCPDREQQRTNQNFVIFTPSTRRQHDGVAVQPRTQLTGRCAHRYANIEGLSPWTKDKLSPEEYLRKEVVELNNGRLAMLACIGLWAQELVQGGQPVMFTLLERIATYEIPALFQEFHQ